MAARAGWFGSVGRQVGLLGVLVLGGLLGLAQARSLAEIQQSKEFRVCIAPIHPALAEVTPPECWEQCTFTGPVYDEVVAFAATLGAEVQLKLRRVVWDTQFHNREGVTVREASYTPALLASGTCDVYPNHLTKRAWRLTKLDIVTLIPNRMMVLVHRTRQAQFRTPADLAGKVAAIEKDVSQHSWLQDENTSTYAANPVRIILMPFNDGIKAVEAGEVDFTLHGFRSGAVGDPVSVQAYGGGVPGGPTGGSWLGVSQRRSRPPGGCAGLFCGPAGRPEFRLEGALDKDVWSVIDEIHRLGNGN